MTQPHEELSTLDDEFAARLHPDVRDIEAPTADAVDQATPAHPSDGPQYNRTTSMEVNEYDALEQGRIVELDDDYR